MTRAVELADENTGLTHDLHDAESTHRLLEEDALSTAQSLSHQLHHTRVRRRGEEERGRREAIEERDEYGKDYDQTERKEGDIKEE